jgi:hypothetical protein
MENTPGQPSVPRKDSDQDFEDIRQGMNDAENPSQDEADRRARIEYLRGLTGHTKPKRGRKLLTWLMILIVIAGLAVGVFWYVSRMADKKVQSRNQSKTNTTAKTEEPTSTQTKHYDSTGFNLGFDYPGNWKVSDEGNGKLLVSSPVSKIKTLSGTTDGQMIFMLQPKQTSLDGFKNGPGTATRVSEKVAYTKPTANQRAQTYMTFVSYAGSSTVGIDSIYVTGDLGYQKDQDVPEKDLIGGDPLVSIFFAKCPNGTCAADPTTTRTAVADSTWSDSNALAKAAKALLLSLTIN